MKITRRGLVRIFCFAFAAVSVLAVRNVCLMKENSLNTLAVQNGYLRAIEELSTAADNINNTLQKELYAGSADMHQNLSQKLWEEASAAKSALSQLPVGELQLENTYKFLSQVGNYALSISEKVREGEEITDEEYETLAALHEFSKTLCEDMWDLENSVQSGEISLTAASESAGEDETTPDITEGFTDFEEGFESYPTLIYDGPFSDHILEKTPRMTEDAEEITQQKALEKCVLTLNINANDLSEVTEENSKMPSWVFSDKDNTVSCAVTKNGGYVSYFLKSRQPANASLTQEEALKYADSFLEDLGILSMQRTYYEQQGSVLTVNYAYNDNGICCYTDLVKVSVAMDNGEILGYDARGFLVNHEKRTYSDDRISVLSAQEKLSPRLEVKSRKLVLIPSDSTEELLCYEFSCTAEDGTSVLVYINALTGAEEQILILMTSESGTLTV